MRVGRHVRISGQVQGVFYRAWTKQQADELGVTGWVRNCPDGSVEAELEGKPGAVERLIERLRSGPRNARVDQVEVRSADPGGAAAFDVRH